MVLQATDRSFELGEFQEMETVLEPKIVSAERLDGGVVVSFSDGETAVYSAALLYAMLPQASRLPEDFLDEEPSVGT